MNPSSSWEVYLKDIWRQTVRANSEREARAIALLRYGYSIGQLISVRPSTPIVADNNGLNRP